MKQMSHPAALVLVLVLSYVLYSEIPDHEADHSVHIVANDAFVVKPARSRPKTAEAILRAGLTASGADPVEGQMHLGNMMSNRGAWEEASDAFQAAAQFATKETKQVAGFHAAATVELRRGDVLKAKDLLKQSIQPFVLAEYQIESFDEYIQYRTLAAEEALIRTRIQIGLANVAEAAVALESADDAIYAIENSELSDGSKVIVSDPVLKGTLESIACSFNLMLRNLDEADLTCGRALRHLKGAERADTLQLLGDVHAASGDAVLASRRYEEALRVGSRSPNGIKLRQLALSRDAIQLEKLLQNLGDNNQLEQIEIETALAEIAIGAGEGTKAMAHLDALETVSPLSDALPLANAQRLALRAAAQLAQAREVGHASEIATEGIFTAEEAIKAYSEIDGLNGEKLIEDIRHLHPFLKSKMNQEYV